MTRDKLMNQNQSGEARSVSPGYANYVLFILCVANVLSVLDRSIMSLLLEPIKNDLGASDTQMSLLTGAAFVIFYSLFGIPIARWADRGNRRDILSIGVALWSAATALCGLAQSFMPMALARAGVGMGEASGTPTSMSLIADYYRREVRPQVISIFNMAVPVGSILITPMLGVIAQDYGWRMAFIVLGAPGLLVALLVRFTIREPARGAMDAPGATIGAQLSFLASLKIMMASRAFVLLLLGTAILGLGVGTMAAWGAAIMMRVHHVSPATIATFVLPIQSAASIGGAIAGGFVTTWAVKRTKDFRLTVLLPAIAAVVTVPAGILVVFGSSWIWMMVGLVVGGASIAFRISPYQALMMDLVPANCRGMAVAASLIATSVVGSAGGPLVVGMISDALTPEFGKMIALQRALIFAPAMLFLGCIPCFLALRHFDANGERVTPLSR